MSAPTVTTVSKDEQAPRGSGPASEAAPNLIDRFRRKPHLPLLGLALVVAVIGALVTGTGSWPHGWTVDVSTPLGNLDEWIVENRDTNWLFVYFLLHFSNWAQAGVDGMTTLLESFGWIGVTVLFTLVAWAAGGADLSRRALRSALTALGVFVVCGVLGMWEPTMETLALMTVAVAASALLGLAAGPGGGAFRPRASASCGRSSTPCR